MPGWQQQLFIIGRQLDLDDPCRARSQAQHQIAAHSLRGQVAQLGLTVLAASCLPRVQQDAGPAALAATAGPNEAWLSACLGRRASDGTR